MVTRIKLTGVVLATFWWICCLLPISPASMVPADKPIHCAIQELAVDRSVMDGNVQGTEGVAVHDVAVTNMTTYKRIVSQGYSNNITVTFQNQGSFTETLYFTITINSTETDLDVLQRIENVETGGQIQSVNGWNTSGFVICNYTISAYVWPVPSEADMEDNTFLDGWVLVTMVGDVTGPTVWPDGIVNIIDVSYVARRFAALPGSPLWNPSADIDSDGKINILDVTIVAGHFGEVQPRQCN